MEDSKLLGPILKEWFCTKRMAAVSQRGTGTGQRLGLRPLGIADQHLHVWAAYS